MCKYKSLTSINMTQGLLEVYANNTNYYSLYSILNFDWSIYLQITACK